PATCRISAGSRPRRSAPGGILDLRSGLLDVALGLAGPALGPQAPAAGNAAGHPLDAALDRFGLMRDLRGDTHGALPLLATVRRLMCWWGCAMFCQRRPCTHEKLRPHRCARGYRAGTTAG